MKPLIVFFLLVFISVKFCISQTKVTVATGLYEKTDVSSKRIRTVYEGEIVKLGKSVGDFWEASYRGNSGYIHKTCLENYVNPKPKVQPESQTPNIVPKAGETVIKSNTGSNSTSRNHHKIEFGLYIGYCISSISGDGNYVAALNEAMQSKGIILDFPMSKDPRSFLFNLGGSIVYNITPTFGLKCRIEYSPKGVEYNGEIDLADDRYYALNQTLRLSYLKFPVSVQFSKKPKKNDDRAHYHMDLGLTPAINVFSKTDVSVSLEEFDRENIKTIYLGTDSKTLPLDGINKFDFGPFCSLGAEWGHFSLDLGYELGLINVIQNHGDGLNLKNHLLSLSFIYMF
jgi:hypothetical protein